MAILSKAEACKDKVQKKDIPTKKCTSFQEKNCCNNKTFVKQSDDIIKTTKTEVDIETLVFINTFFYTYINLFEGLKENVIPFEHYRSPLISKDIQVLQEVYLI